MHSEALRIHRDIGLAFYVAVDLCDFAAVFAGTGRAEAAARLLSKAEALSEEIGGSFEGWAEEQNEETLAALRADLDEPAFAEAWEQGRKLTVDEAVALALGSSG